MSSNVSPLLADSGLIKVVPGLMIWTLICFGITFFVLRRYAFRPIQKAIDTRRDRIREALDEADRARSEAEKLVAEQREQLEQARAHAEAMLAEARSTAEAQNRRLREELDAERQRRLEETRKEIEAETARAIGQIRSEVADLALEATEKVTGKVLTEADQRRLIEEAIGELDFSALEKEAV
jgi:F-type H+-transporting ATPase subunit b